MVKYFGCHENIIRLYDLVTIPYACLTLVSYG